MADLLVKNGQIVYVNNSGKVVYSLPDSDGVAGQALVTDGNGKLSFVTDQTISIKTADGVIVAELNGRTI